MLLDYYGHSMVTGNRSKLFQILDPMLISSASIQ
jgi:hypothetical protein